MRGAVLPLPNRRGGGVPGAGGRSSEPAPGIDFIFGHSVAVRPGGFLIEKRGLRRMGRPEHLLNLRLRRLANALVKVLVSPRPTTAAQDEGHDESDEEHRQGRSSASRGHLADRFHFGYRRSDSSRSHNRRAVQTNAYPWAKSPVTIRPSEVRSHMVSGCSSPYIPPMNPPAIATTPAVRAIMALNLARRTRCSRSGMASRYTDCAATVHMVSS